MKCECKKILWIKLECKSCKKSRIKSNQKWEKDHTFVYGEKIFINDDFMGRKVEGTIVDKEEIYHHSLDIGHGYTEINYSIKLYDGNIIKLSRYNVQKT